MKTKDIGFWVLFIIAMTIVLAMSTSCNAPRKVTTNAERQLDMDLLDKRMEDWNRTLTEKMQQTFEELLRTQTVTEVEQVRTVLSAPDSAGVQFTQEQTVTRMNTRTTGEQERRSTREDSTRVDEAMNAEQQTTVEAEENSSQQVKEVVRSRISWWQATLLFLGIGLVVYIIFKLFLKRKQP